MSVLFFVTAELAVLTGALATLIWKRSQQAALRPVPVRAHH